MLKFVGEVLVAKWLLGIVGVMIAGGIVYVLVKGVAGEGDVAG